MTKEARIDNGEVTASSIMVLGKLDSYMQNNPIYYRIKKNKIPNLPKKAKDLYSENYKTLMTETEDDTNNGRIYHACGLEELLLIMTILPKAIITFNAIPSKY